MIIVNATTQYQPMVPDTGYTKYCLCGARFGEDDALIGRERFIDLTECPKCAAIDPEIKQKRRLAMSRYN